MQSLADVLESALFERMGATDISIDIGDSLAESVAATRRFVRGLDRLESVGFELAKAAREAEKMRREQGVEYAMRRSPLSNMVRAFEKAASGLYGDFANGRNATMSMAQKSGISTRRTSKRVASKPGSEIRGTDLVREAARIGRELNPVIREAGELGSVVLREGDKLLKKMPSGQRQLDMLTAYVQAYLDFRDQVSKALFSQVAAVAKRLREQLQRLSKMNEDAAVDMPWLQDPDLCWIIEDIRPVQK